MGAECGGGWVRFNLWITGQVCSTCPLGAWSRSPLSNPNQPLHLYYTQQ